MSDYEPTSFSPGMIFGWVVHTVVLMDLMLRIFLAEQNTAENLRWLNTWKSRSREHKDPQVVATLIGYREDLLLFSNCLERYLGSGCKCLVVGIDGNQPEDEKMVSVFGDVFSNHGDAIILRLDTPIAWLISEDISDANIHETIQTRDLPAFAKLYDFMKCQLEKSRLTGVLSTNEAPLFVVLADLYDTEFIWSSDSDTLVSNETLSNMAKILFMEERAAGASALVRLNNSHESFVSNMASAGFMCDAFLNRASLSALGRSEYLNGPGSVFRKSALRDVAIAWYHYSYPGSTHLMSINEENQLTMLLALKGWDRLYIDQSIIHTAAPTTLKGWLGQRRPVKSHLMSTGNPGNAGDLASSLQLLEARHTGLLH
ncbi:hypothetical protein Q7P37_001931 [Cladosporium fusiforme]